MRLELERSLELFFKKTLKKKQTITHPLLVFPPLLLYFQCLKNICSHPICAQNLLNLVNE